MNEETNICQYQKFAIKRTTKTTYKISVLQNIILVCFDIVLLWITMVIETCDNHYYDENEIEVGKPIQCQVAVNHIVELTAEEKAEARQQAVRRYQDEELRKLQNRTKPTKAKTETQVQPSLFDFGL